MAEFAGRMSRWAGPCAVLLGLALATPVLAADAPGCADPAGLKRFEGAELVICETRDFAEVEIPTGKLMSWDYSAQKPNFESKLDVEGKPSFNVYLVPPGPSSAEVFRNYKSDLEANGFALLYEAKGADFGVDQGRIFENRGPGNQLFGYSTENSRYASAVKDEGARKTYVSLYVIEYAGGLHPKIVPQPKQVLVRLDVLVSGELEERMEVVSASEIEKSIAESGRVTLYGILFDFNKSDIKDESRPALDEIAKFLEADPERKLHVVGHTDAVGSFDFNLKLSKARANAVVSELVKTYGIAAGRLKGNGVGMLAPIATNGTDEGRAKNRRVELVPM
jgi:outer membrane protein OmpA-like peptidoglycan-associated protein